MSDSLEKQLVMEKIIKNWDKIEEKLQFFDPFLGTFLPQKNVG
jgi:hypothetical protein